MRCLFSRRADWEPFLRNTLARTGHVASFDALTADTLTAHDVVIPLSLADVLALHALRPWLAHSPLPIPVPDVARLCHDKLALNQALIARGWGGLIPALSVHEWTQPPWPFIVKARQGEWGMGTRLVHGPADLPDNAAALATGSHFSQAYISSHQEFAAHLVMKDGQLQAALTVDAWFDTDTAILGRHQRPVRRRVVACPHLAVFEQVLASLGFEGLCCLDYREHAGQPWLFEINPRMGGSLCGHLPALLAQISPSTTRGIPHGHPNSRQA